MEELHNYSIANIYLGDYFKYNLLKDKMTATRLLKEYERKKQSIKDPVLIKDLEATLHNIEKDIENKK